MAQGEDALGLIHAQGLALGLRGALEEAAGCDPL